MTAEVGIEPTAGADGTAGPAFVRSSALPGLELRTSAVRGSCYRLHSHETCSIGMIDAGSTVLTGPPSGRIRLHAGDVVVIPAGQVHACNPDAGVWRYRMIHLGELQAAGLPADRILVLRDPAVHRAASAWADAIAADAARSEISGLLEALLQQIGEADPVAVAGNGADRELLEQLAPVLARLRDDEGNPSLDELGAMVGLSRFQLIRRVRRATGLTPLAWRQNARISRARALLRDGDGIAETAHAVGFGDQSHLHRVFRAHVAASPGAYRARTRGASAQ